MPSIDPPTPDSLAHSYRRMVKVRIDLPDGRYLIFYRFQFDDEKEVADSSQTEERPLGTHLKSHEQEKP